VRAAHVSPGPAEPWPGDANVERGRRIHEGQLAKYGGAAGIRDLGLLESAVATPKATFGGAFVHEDLFAMAAAYAFHIGENQPFVDGNKRTGVLAAVVFLDSTGTSSRSRPPGSTRI
jgi:death on curing protein